MFNTVKFFFFVFTKTESTKVLDTIIRALSKFLKSNADNLQVLHVNFGKSAKRRDSFSELGLGES